ncbi:YlcI/YnfO family protein [Ideonella sp. DXS22W]|uniref:YlcI/YnfO family protein n=1 Tax=Pseudaquabacterium inlustre TaxID=2984192 RepID=A0ABU9CA49_9BURK
MKTAILPQVRVEPQLKADVESVLREGETLSDFLEATVRQAVDQRRMQAEFSARAEAAWTRFQQTAAGTPADTVVDELRTRLTARRRELQNKRRPAGARASPSSSTPKHGQTC